MLLPCSCVWLSVVGLSRSSTLVRRGGNEKQNSRDRDVKDEKRGTQHSREVLRDALQALKEEERAVGGALRSLAKDLQVDNEAVSAFREVRAF